MPSPFGRHAFAHPVPLPTQRHLRARISEPQPVRGAPVLNGAVEEPDRRSLVVQQAAALLG
jgi:hypothetical protein